MATEYRLHIGYITPGAWTRNQLRPKPDPFEWSLEPYEPSILLSPSRFRRHARNDDYVDLPANRMKHQSMATGRCIFLELPTELLLRIARYVIPTQTSFHIFAYASDDFRPITVVQHASNESNISSGPWPNSPRSRVHFTALAYVCRRLNGIYRSVMYGENQFVFDVSAQAFMPKLMPIRPNFWNIFGGENVESKTCTFDREPKDLWPLSVHTMAYVKDLTVVATTLPSDKDLTFVCDRLKIITPLIESMDMLTQLTIYVGGRQTYSTSPTREPLEIWQDDDGTFRLGPETTNCGPECKVCWRSRAVWDVCKRIRFRKDVHLIGHIDQRRAEEITTAMKYQTEEP